MARMLNGLERVQEVGWNADFQFVHDGEDLLDYLDREGRCVNLSLSLRPDLIILDLNMPGMDGREALREIKAEPVFKRMPVVVLTTF